MAAIDGNAAANVMRGFRNLDPGMCLYYVWQAYKAVGASTGRSAGTAADGWDRTDGRHPGDRNPPPGVPVWWGRRYDGNTAGDVVISLGGGLVVCTDYPTWGRIGVCTIDEREAQIGRSYLGWSECIFDQPVQLPAPPASVKPAPSLRQEDEEMLLLIIDNRYCVSVTRGLLKHWAPGEPREVVKNVERINDDWQHVTFEEFAAILRENGCDRDIWDVRKFKSGTDFCVLDPLTGTVLPGNCWTDVKQLRAEMRGIKAPTIDPGPVLEAARAGAKQGVTEALNG